MGSFFTLDEGGGVNSLRYNFESYKDHIPDAFIPIGDDQAGNLIILGVAGKTQGQLYFWCHEQMNEWDGTDIQNLGFVAPSLDAFFESLYET